MKGLLGIFFRKLDSLFFKTLIHVLWLLSGGKHKLHMTLMIWWLRRKGVKFTGKPIYIAATVKFDGGGYSLITIGDRTVISSDVVLLVHDYAISRALEALEAERPNTEVAFLRPVHIGNNTFVGTRAILMPGSYIGSNVIIGAGSVVRGRVPDNAIVMGNPAEIIGNTLEYARDRKQFVGGPSSRFD